MFRLTARHATKLLPLVLAVTLPVPPAYGEQPLSTSPVAVVMDVGLQQDGKRLELRLTNHGTKALEIYRSALPWGNTYSMVVVGVVLHGTNEVIQAPPLIDDPGPDSILFRPSETLTGSIKLFDRFPKLEDALGKSDVIVFWSYQLETVDGATSQRFNGTVTLKRATP